MIQNGISSCDIYFPFFDYFNTLFAFFDYNKFESETTKRNDMSNINRKVQEIIDCFSTIIELAMRNVELTMDNAKIKATDKCTNHYCTVLAEYLNEHDLMIDQNHKRIEALQEEIRTLTEQSK